MAGRRLVLGVDSSTQSTKVEARELSSGEVVATSSAKHPATHPPVSEQDPAAWWDALVVAVGQLGEHRRDVVAVSVAGQQHGLVLCDADGLPLRDAKLWNDTTSASNADALVRAVDARTWARRTGSVPVAAFTISKLAWVAEHEPDVIARTAMVMLPHDWLTWKLSGSHVTDRGDASGTGWFDPSANQYLPDLVRQVVDDGAGWIDRLPRVLGPSDVAGELSAVAAAELGLPIGIVVGPGSGDNMAAALGLGLGSGDVRDLLGHVGNGVRRVGHGDGRCDRRGRRVRQRDGELPAAGVHAQRDEGHRSGCIVVGYGCGRAVGAGAGRRRIRRHGHAHSVLRRRTNTESS